MRRYHIITAQQIPNAGGHPILVGAPIPAHMISDLAIASRDSFEYIPLNSCVLREALLDSADFLEKYLNVKITDVENTQEEKEKETPQERDDPKPAAANKTKPVEKRKQAPRSIDEVFANE